jgi:signal transduction histidine kinase
VRLSGQKEMNLLRIAQEAVANAVKHGRPRQVNIELRYTATSVCLNVVDDGCGFSANQAAPIGHFGLLDMRERSHSMGSEMSIVSEPGRGTRISLQVPLAPTDPKHAELETNPHSSG